MKTSLTNLHESYIKRAEQPLFGTKLPVIPKNDDKIVIPTAKWVNNEGQLEKTFRFLSVKIRNQFINELLEYEEHVGHNANMSIEKNNVFIRLFTEDTDKISELDKEYARHADLVYKDVLYNNV